MSRREDEGHDLAEAAIVVNRYIQEFHEKKDVSSLLQLWDFISREKRLLHFFGNHILNFGEVLLRIAFVVRLEQPDVDDSILQWVVSSLAAIARESASPAVRCAALRNLANIAACQKDADLLESSVDELKTYPEFRERDDGFLEFLSTDYPEHCVPRPDPVRPSFILHPGFAKCASTWLQRSWFPFLIGNRHLGRTHVDYFVVGGTAEAPRIEKREVIFQSDKERGPLRLDRSDFSDEMLTDIVLENARNGLTTTMSDEGFVYLIDGNFGNTKEGIRRILECRKIDVNVMIVIRRPSELIKSLYAYMVRNGIVSSGIEDSINPGDGVLNDRINLREYDFLDVYRQFAELLPRSSIHVIPFERLVEDPPAALSGVGRHLDGRNGILAAAIRDTSPANVGGRGDAANQYSSAAEQERVAREVGGLFASACRKLDEMCDLGLGRLGYY